MMWILLFITLLDGRIDTVKIAEIHQSRQDCIKRGDQASEIGIPIGMTLKCIPLKGVAKTNGKKLQ